MTDRGIVQVSDQSVEDGTAPGTSSWESLKDEVADLSRFLYAKMQEYARDELGKPICYDSSRYPYFFNDTNDNGVCDNGEASFFNRYTAWDGRLLRAAHNYQHSLKEVGAWAHNFAYVTQLVIDSIVDLTGSDGGFIRPPP